jgi:Asp-tRNA(Asn)/Glu-tRNA(Gln) amidotransferase A subunit family amidase
VGFSIGSETNGSIVMPSTVCGVSGLRPTFGRVSRRGAMNLSFSMDKLGPLCRTLEDCAWVFAAIHGADVLDPASIEAPFAWPPRRESVAGMTVGFLARDFEQVRNAGDAALNRQTLEQLESLGVKLVPKALPDFPVDPLRMILMVEAAAMFDELTLSNRDDELGQQHPLAWPNSFRTARMIPAVEYLKAQQARTVLMEKMEATMEGIDALVTPSTTGATLPITNLTGHPAAVMPNGFVRGTPRSVTLIGPLFGDDRILRLGRAYQGSTDWHTRHPVLA